MTGADRAAFDALVRLRGELVGGARRQAIRRRRRRVGFVVAALALVAVSTASAAYLLSARDVTPADVARQATVVRADSWLDCATTPCVIRQGSHTQVDLQPWMGVTLVLPSGFPVRIYPGAIGLGPLPTYLNRERAAYGLPGLDADGRFSPGTISQTDSGGQWHVSLPEGTTRTISWSHDSGTTTITDHDSDGGTHTVAVHSGQVISLVPDMPQPEQRTAEKAITFDLPNGAQVFIFPTFNETYVGALPVGGRAPDESFAPGTAELYGLVPLGKYSGALPVTPGGGSWTVTEGLLTRKVTWNAGEPGITIQLLRSGHELEKGFVTVGHELPLWPPK